MQHGSAPDDGLAVGNEHADGHDLDAGSADGRNNHAVDDLRVVVDAQHTRNREAVDIGIHDADLQSCLRHRSSKVRGHGGLADATLTGGNSDNTGQRIGLSKRDFALGATAVQLLAQSFLLFVGHDPHVNLDVLNTLNGANSFDDVSIDRGAQRATGGGQKNLDGDGGAVNGDLLGAGHVEVDDGTVNFGIDDRFERGHHLID